MRSWEEDRQKFELYESFTFRDERGERFYVRITHPSKRLDVGSPSTVSIDDAYTKVLAAAKKCSPDMFLYIKERLGL